MADRDVKPTDDGWQVLKKGAQRASAKAPTQVEAVARATEIVAKDGGGKVVVYGTDGKVRESQTVKSGERGARQERRQGHRRGRERHREGRRRQGRGHRRHGRRRRQGHRREDRRPRRDVRQEGRGAGRGRCVEGVAEEAKAARNGNKAPKAAVKDAAAVAQTTGAQVAETTGRAGERITKDTARAGKRAGQTVGAAADEAGAKAVSQADRADKVSSSIDGELNTVGDDVAGKHHQRRRGPQARAVDATVKEVSRQVEQTAPSYNPVRIAGQVAGFAVRTTFSVTGADGLDQRARPRRGGPEGHRPPLKRALVERQQRARLLASEPGPFCVFTPTSSAPVACPVRRGRRTCSQRDGDRLSRLAGATHLAAVLLGGATPDAGLLAGVEAQRRQAERIGQVPQMYFAAVACSAPGPSVPTGKKSSGSWSRHAASSQSMGPAVLSSLVCPGGRPLPDARCVRVVLPSAARARSRAPASVTP